MKKLLFALLIIFHLQSFAQSIKKQIGHTVWKRKGTIVADTSVDYVFHYDRQNRRITEWRIQRDLNGQFIDSNYTELDTCGRQTHVFIERQHYFYEYDSLGTLIKMIRSKTKDTSIYHPVYQNEKLIYTIQDFGKIQYNDTTKYSYKGNTITETSNSLIRIRKQNKLNQPIYTELIINRNQEEYKQTFIFKCKRDAKGNVLVYEEEKNGVLLRKTSLVYKNGRAISQIDSFYDPDYESITSFTYEYW